MATIRSSWLAAATACTLIAAAHASALSTADAKRVAAAAIEEARRIDAPSGAIAVVDEGGHLLYLERLENTFPAASPIAIEKARTAAVFRRPTADFEQAVNDGRVAFVANAQALPLQGGVPIVADGRVVGAIGVSGAASATQDTQLAQAGAAAALGASAPPAVTQLDAERVRAAFAKGEPLVETAGYKVHASRRDAPGQAEVHTRDTDVIYVLSGTATFVTGGRVVEPKEVAAGEIRGSRIEGGTQRTLAPGEVIVVPNGTPHWFQAVPGPFTYYVVKPTAGE